MYWRLLVGSLWLLFVTCINSKPFFEDKSTQTREQKINFHNLNLYYLYSVWVSPETRDQWAYLIKNDSLLAVCLWTHVRWNTQMQHTPLLLNPTHPTPTNLYHQLQQILLVSSARPRSKNLTHKCPLLKE